jgi:hypothetical protein
MKLNATISQTIALIAGCKNPEKWVNVPVTFFVDERVKFGSSTVEAIRVKAQKDAPKVDYTDQINKLRACRTLVELQTIYTALDKPAQYALVTIKDEMKGLLK